MAKMLLILMTLSLWGSPELHAEEEELGILSRTRPSKGYFKRDRALIGGRKTISPTQLHEVYELRLEGDFEYLRSTSKSPSRNSTLVAPTFNANAVYGGDQMTLGFGVGYTQASNESNIELYDEYNSFRALPQLAYTFQDHFTLGVGATLGQLRVSRLNNNEEAGEFDMFWSRPALAFAFHTPKMELGVKYEHEVLRSDFAQSREAEGGLTLAPVDTSKNRLDLYIPAQTTAYARGNVLPEISLMGRLGYARYDGNVKGAIELFEDYDTSDRLLADLQVTYWTIERSRLSVSADYVGAATAESGLNQSGQSYRIANLYGTTLSGAISWSKESYLGAQLSFLRGELDETKRDVDYNFNEQQTKFITSYTKKF